MHPNVLLVIADSVRARNTSLHGHSRDTTPFLENFGERATVYERAYAPAPKSLTSHTSIFTGLAAEEHGITFRDTALAPGNTVWETLADEHGYSTGVFSANTFLTKLDVGLKDAFDHVYDGRSLPREDGLDPREYLASDGSPAYAQFLRDALRSRSVVPSMHNGVAVLRQSGSGSRDARRFVNAFLEWERERDGPWAACLNLMDAHTPYLPPAEHNQWADERTREIGAEIDGHVWEFQCGHRPWGQLERIEAIYDEAIHYVDAQLERLYEELERRDDAEDTLLVVTSDHGEGFGEESRIRPDTRLAGHGEAKLHEVLLHVPLLVKAPGQERGATVSDPVSLSLFPDAVETAVSGDSESRLFDSGGPVLATAVGLQDADNDGAGRYCDDLSSFMGRGRAVYETTPNGVRKHMTWKDHSVSLALEADGTVRQLEDGSTRDRVVAAFSGVEDAGVARENRSEVDEETLQELKDLGYA